MWNVNPDNNSVTVTDEQGVVLAEISVGQNPWGLAKRPLDTKVYVTNKEDATLSVIDTGSLSVTNTIALPRGSQPHGIVFDANGSHYHVVLEATAALEARCEQRHFGNELGTERLASTSRHDLRR